MRNDVAPLFEGLSNEKAVYCVQHDYKPKEKHKMDGQQQTIYPRKNWSSFIVFNCSHPSNKKLNSGDSILVNLLPWKTIE